jgi:hypothetical protein
LGVLGFKCTCSINPELLAVFRSYSGFSSLTPCHLAFGTDFSIQQGMAKNCSSDVSLVIDHVDAVLLNGTDSEIFSLKQSFGLEDLEHNDDFAAALQNGPWLWQSNQFYRSGGFFEFCDAVENVNRNSTNATALPGAEGVGLEKGKYIHS